LLVKFGLGERDNFEKLYVEQKKVLGRDLDENEVVGVMKTILQRLLAKTHSINDITPKDQEELTRMAAESLVSPSRPPGSAIIKFPKAAKLSGSDLRKNLPFFTAAEGIISDDQLLALHRLKPEDKLKLFEFSPQEAKHFTPDEIINSTVGELKGVKVKNANTIQGYVNRKSTIPFRYNYY